MELMTMEVIDWHGPIVEIAFNRPVVARSDVEKVLQEARSFMQRHLADRGDGRAFFVSCYDGFSVTHECAPALQQGFVEFNRAYSKGDVRYGGSSAAKTIIISTAIKTTSPSEIHADREAALATLRRKIPRQK